MTLLVTMLLYGHHVIPMLLLLLLLMLPESSHGEMNLVPYMKPLLIPALPCVSAAPRCRFSFFCNISAQDRPVNSCPIHNDANDNR